LGRWLAPTGREGRWAWWAAQLGRWHAQLGQRECSSTSHSILSGPFTPSSRSEGRPRPLHAPSEPLGVLTLCLNRWKPWSALGSTRTPESLRQPHPRLGSEDDGEVESAKNLDCAGRQSGGLRCAARSPTPGFCSRREQCTPWLPFRPPVPRSRRLVGCGRNPYSLHSASDNSESRTWPEERFIFHRWPNSLR